MNNLKQLIEEINNRPQDNPEETINNIIELMKVYSMDTKSMNMSSMFMITSDGKFSHVPIASNLLHGDMGEMMIKSYLNKVKKENHIANSLIEINFGHGIVAKFDKSEEDKFNELSKELKEGLQEAKTPSEFIHSRKDFQDYFIVNIYKENKAEMKIYDIITSVDKQGKTIKGEAFIIAPKPTIEEELQYDGQRIINYFK